MASDDSKHRPMEHATNRIDWSAVLSEQDSWLRTVLLARLGDPLSVDDVLQDVRASLVAKGHLLRDPAKLAPWLYRVAVTSALAYRRRVGRQRKLITRYAEQLPPTSDDAGQLDPLAWLLADETVSLVRRALDRLPAREAEILLLKYTQDWSYRQIAEHLGLSISAVEARLHRARERLRKGLAALDPTLAPYRNP